MQFGSFFAFVQVFKKSKVNVKLHRGPLAYARGSWAAKKKLPSSPYVSSVLPRAKSRQFSPRILARSASEIRASSMARKLGAII